MICLPEQAFLLFVPVFVKLLTMRKSKPPKIKDQEKDNKESKRMTPDNYVLYLLSRREYSQKELRQKLKYREVSTEEIDAVLEKMTELGLQSDQRFLESRVRMQKSAGKGPGYLRAELGQHQLSSEKIQEVLESDEHNWTEAAFDLVERKFGVPPFSLDVQRKAFSLLLRRGFSFDLAKKATTRAREDFEE